MEENVEQDVSNYFVGMCQRCGREVWYVDLKHGLDKPYHVDCNKRMELIK